MGLTPNGDPIKTIIVSDAEGIQQLPDVSFGNDIYLVVWFEARTDNQYKVLASRVSPAWEVLDPGNIVEPYSTTQITPAIAFDGDRFLVVWRDLDYPSIGIRCRFVDSNGQPQDSAFIVTDSQYATNPKLIFGDEYYLVAWQEDSPSVHEIMGQFVSPDGILVGVPFVIGSGSEGDGALSGCSVCYGENTYLVIWSKTTIWGQFVSSSGDLVGPNFPVSNSTNIQMMPGVAVAHNKYLVAWSEYDNDFNIFGNIDAQVALEESPSIPQKTILYPASTLFTNSLEIIGWRGKNVAIFDLTGRKVGQTTEGKLNTASLPSGIYFINVEQTQHRFKVVKISQRK